MANKDLRKTAHVKGDGSYWWYEEPKGIVIVIPSSNAEYTADMGRQFQIPWGPLRKALARKDKK